MKEEMITIPKSVYESEKKMRFFGASSDEIYNKRFHIFIGISISNKKITGEMALNYLTWAVRNTKGKVAVIIADELNIVNYEILDKYSKGKAKKRAQSQGSYFEELFLKQIKKLPLCDQPKIEIYKWETVLKDKKYLELKEFLEKQYEIDSEFKSAVLYFVKKYMRKKERIINDKRKTDRLASYILGELPTLLEGITIDGIHYGLCIYPTYFASGMSQFVMDLVAEELDIGKKINKLVKHKSVLVEAWLD
ncbi:MAG: tRNA-dependent cyclodipeptide synthase [Nanoarchaeota archaeon]|nr:tRNA-dependent cyclodipeptide synthase [Nanoarchaeota archaeon]MBU1321442.1 tRNA-dependent cyclodipeptide synthase [Nanoarchaeota archaeon]MBU1596898.1 tRNA-dependent cyclodipeptide synthase [Nanoarchaeota archaeon]MBU2441565.1 tRNA-dependent cyclodipeptide synthase [Nanoarchaeota archaeon]